MFIGGGMLSLLLVVGFDWMLFDVCVFLLFDVDVEIMFEVNLGMFEVVKFV